MRKSIATATLLSASFLSILLPNTALACTDFKITATDGTVLIARSMEFALDFKSNVRSSPRDRTFNTNAIDGKPGLSWRSKYGYVYADGLNVDSAIDGMNEKGLSFEYLYLPGETQYQTATSEQDKQALPYISLGDWVLGNFQTVEEVRQALTTIYVTDAKIPSIPNVTFPLHAAIYDASGKGIVVEFVKGKMQISDNTIGVMTNSPTYEWQVTNLRNYIGMSPYAPKPVTINGITYAATGQGSGMIGLPGDVSPPSRFVKTAVLKTAALPVNNAAGALNLAEHIINTVDIPLGTVRAKQSDGKDSNDLTQWVVFKDLTHKIFYYRTYDNMTVRAIDLSKIDFAPTAARLKMPMNNGPYVQDETQKFLTQKAN